MPLIRLSSITFDLHFDPLTFVFPSLRTTFFFIRLLLSNPFCSDIFTLLFMSWSASVDFNLGCCTSVMRWPLCHVSVFRGSTTNRHPNLEGEQVEQQTTALHHSLWRRRWAESFVEFYAHLEYFFY